MSERESERTRQKGGKEKIYDLIKKQISSVASGERERLGRGQIASWSRLMPSWSPTRQRACWMMIRTWSGRKIQSWSGHCCVPLSQSWSDRGPWSPSQSWSDRGPWSRFLRSGRARGTSHRCCWSYRSDRFRDRGHFRVRDRDRGRFLAEMEQQWQLGQQCLCRLSQLGGQSRWTKRCWLPRWQTMR